MGKKEEREKEKALAKIEEKFNAPEYHGQRVLTLIGIICSGIIMAIAIMQLYTKVMTVTVGTVSVSYADRLSASGVNPLSAFAPFFWAFSAM